jgi:hypothetical protein
MSAIMTKTFVEAAVRLGVLIESHAREAGRELGEKLRPWLREGEVLPDFSLVLQLPARMVEQAGTRLHECQDGLDQSMAQEGEARTSRDQKASMLRKDLVELRKLFSAVFGSQRAAKVLGIDIKTADASQHELLLSQAEAVLKALGEPLRLASPAHFHVEPASAAEALEPLVAASREACCHLDGVRRASATRREARDHARAHLGRGVHAVVSIFGGWLDLVRRPDLAKRLHRLQRRYSAENAKNARKAKKTERKEVPM